MVSSIIAVLVAAASMYIVWWVFRGVQHVPAVLNILDLYTFEWKPSEEIETYKRRWERIVGDGTVRRAVVEGDVVSESEDTPFDEEEIPTPLLSELQLSEDTPFDEEEIAMLAKILGIVLIRKKPMGKRPPRLRSTSRRQIVAGLSGLGSPA